jgi:hypothetical protein
LAITIPTGAVTAQRAIRGTIKEGLSAMTDSIAAGIGGACFTVGSTVDIDRTRRAYAISTLLLGAGLVDSAVRTGNPLFRIAYTIEVAGYIQSSFRRPSCYNADD